MNKVTNIKNIVSNQYSKFLRKKIEFLFFFLISTLVILRLILIFKGSEYSWDLDHEMYFGSRLKYNELIYFNEYNDKLPIVQYLFYERSTL